MRRIGVLAVFLCSALTAAFSAETSVLYYSTNPCYPPYHWGIADGGFDGASVELLSLVLPSGVRAEPVREPWMRALALAADGEIDLLLSLRNTPERSKFLVFATHRAFPNPIAVFVRADSEIRDAAWERLKGYVGGMSLGDTFGGGFDEYLRAQLNIESAPSMVENFEKLRLGRIDYFVSGYYMGQSYLSASDLAGKIVALRPFVSNQDIYFAFSKKSPWIRILPELNAALSDLDRKGVLEALLKKHLERFSGPDAPRLFR